MHAIGQHIYGFISFPQRMQLRHSLARSVKSNDFTWSTGIGSNGWVAVELIRKAKLRTPKRNTQNTLVHRINVHFTHATILNQYHIYWDIFMVHKYWPIFSFQWMDWHGNKNENKKSHEKKAINIFEKVKRKKIVSHIYVAIAYFIPNTFVFISFTFSFRRFVFFVLHWGNWMYGIYMHLISLFHLLL